MLQACPHTTPPENGAAAARIAVDGGLDIRLLPAGHPVRPAAEALIQSVYADAFGATVRHFPRLLVATLDWDGHPVCAAGLRTTGDGFFSEAYLDQPVERALSAHTGRHVHRARVFEVTTLASRRADLSPAFVHQIALLGETQGFEWCFFTATERLRRLLRRLKLPITTLGAADPARIADAAAWGRYYASAPVVCAADDWPTRLTREDAPHA